MPEQQGTESGTGILPVHDGTGGTPDATLDQQCGTGILPVQNSTGGTPDTTLDQQCGTGILPVQNSTGGTPDTTLDQQCGTGILPVHDGTGGTPDTTLDQQCGTGILPVQNSTGGTPDTTLDQQCGTGILPVQNSTGGTTDATLDLFFEEHAETHITERNLPHWRQEGKLYFVTWRLADSLPSEKREQLRQDRENWQRQHGTKARKDLTLEQRRAYYQLFHQRVQQWLDAGSGSCILRQEGPRRIMVDALKYFHDHRYQLGHFAVAANHVHVLVRPLPGHTLSGILHSWKSFTATAINRLLGRTGQLWQDESYDHLVRNEAELQHIEEYIMAHRTSGGYVEGH